MIESLSIAVHAFIPFMFIFKKDELSKSMIIITIIFCLIMDN